MRVRREAGWGVEVFESERRRDCPTVTDCWRSCGPPSPASGGDRRRYVRVVTLPHGPGDGLRPDGDRVAARFELSDPTDSEGVRRAHLLTSTPTGTGRRAARQDLYLAPLVRSTPGIRLPGQVDGFEVVVRATASRSRSVGTGRPLEIAAPRRRRRPLLARRYGLTHAFMICRDRVAGRAREYHAPGARSGHPPGGGGADGRGARAATRDRP